MSEGKLIQRILNLLTVALLVLLIGRIFFILPFFNVIGTFPAVIALGVVYFTKSWVEVRFNLVDPINANRITKLFYNSGMGVIVLAIMFKILHWPYQNVLTLIGAALIVIALILSILLDPSEEERDENILDDID